MSLGKLNWIVLLLALGQVGCVSVYQPLSGLQAPVVVDPALGNFDGVRILVHCVPKDVLKGEAGKLCQRVRTLFENQGAYVKSVTSLARSSEDAEFDRVDLDEPPPPAAKPGEAKEGESAEASKKKKEPRRIKADLIVELRARNLHEDTDYLMWTLSWFTFTLAPGISENTFVQEVIIRDARGSPLFTGQLKGRIVRYFGLGYWVGTKLINWIGRDDHEDQNDEQLSKALSADLYGQLSQMVFNANMRRRVLGGPELANEATP